MNGYRDRRAAGAALAELLNGSVPEDSVVLALPRGGAPIGLEIARALGAPLDVLVVRKLGVPDQPELAFGAIASDDIRVLDDNLLARLGISSATVERIASRETDELHRREGAYRRDRPPIPVADRTVVVADDGLATGATMTAAILALRARSPTRIVVAVPVGAPQAVIGIAKLADEVVCPLQPEGFSAVGAWYDDFEATSDDEVRALLAEAARFVQKDL